MARILVVDDETEIRDLIKDVLVVGGHSIETAANGAAALALLRGKRYDVVILDRNMPGISGIEVLAQLRRLPSCKGVKVMMCTASGTMGDVDDALSAGADDYLVKPRRRLRPSWRGARRLPSRARASCGRSSP